MAADNRVGELGIYPGLCERPAPLDEWRVLQVDCSDPVAFADALRGWDWQLTRLEPGEFAIQGITLPLDDLQVARLRFNRALQHRVRPSAGRVSLLFFAQHANPIFVDGQEITSEDCTLLHADSSSEIFSHGACVALAISMSEETWRRRVHLGRCGGLNLRGRDRLLRFARAGVCELLAAVDHATRDGNAPDAFFERRLLNLCDALGEQEPRPAPPHAQLRRRSGVERARRYIVKHLADKIRLADLCRHAHLQARALEYAFRDFVGVSPVAYLKLLRLAETHRRLLSSEDHGRSISEIALDAGFWHLSQFGVDYKKLFLESPSATHERAPVRGEPTLSGVAPQKFMRKFTPYVRGGLVR
jgi:AraC family ethanolamine operon transcriptional activator